MCDNILTRLNGLFCYFSRKSFTKFNIFLIISIHLISVHLHKISGGVIFKRKREVFFYMRLDSAFVKEILITMVKYDDYLINSHTLMSLLNVKGKEMERKFMGHILILGDEGLIESIYSKFPFGFVNSVDGNYSIVDTGYRLTSKGFKMVEVLMSS